MRILRYSKHRRAFQHDPLDHTRSSIRLVEIRPGLSDEGLIRCKISHASVESRYTCLSYRWGDDNPSTSRIILLNGKPFTVRQNLYDFLFLACIKQEWSQVTQRKYWIDALCINQSDKCERNHQVAQMGKIYAGARRVHIWLGKTSHIHRVSALLSDTSSDGSGYVKPFELQKDLNLVGRYVLHNEYWNRAWVVQEIILARNVVVSLNMTTLSLLRFCRKIDRLHLDLTQTPFQQFEIYHNPASLQSLRNMSLLSLLDRFRDKDCAVPRDRVFSLLAMCHPAEQIHVDYGSPWTDIFVQILAKTRYIPCICSAALLARSLAPPRLAKPDDTMPYAEPMLTFEIADVCLGDIDLLSDKYVERAIPNSCWENGRVKKDLGDHKLGHRACLWHLLRILRHAIGELDNPVFPPVRHLSNARFEYQQPLSDILSDLSKDMRLLLESGDTPSSFVKLFRAFLRSRSKREHHHRFQRMGSTLRLFNVSPGWYMSEREDSIGTVAVHVSLSALGKASEGIALCGWQGEKDSLTRDDGLFRQFSLYYPPEDREGEYT